MDSAPQNRHGPHMSLNRRSFLRATATSAIAAPYIGWKTTANGASPSNNLRFVCFGSNGRAWGNITSMAGVENTTLVAVAEIDLSRADKTREKFPEAKVYQDWRKLLEKEADNFDVAIVSTPDHMHAPIAMSAMQLGKHTYCEKPLTRTLHECRTLQSYAADNNIATQMGIQVSSSQGNKTGVKWLREGIIGKVKSVHSMNPKSWGSMDALPDRADPVPATLNWDNWLGVRPTRSYIAREYHPSQWRKRLDFGTGTLGDMGCHIYHPWYQGLNQPDVLEVTSLGPGPVDKDSWPLNSKVHYLMKGNDQTDGDFPFTWYDGNQRADESVAKAVGGVENVPSSGSVVIGESGALVIPHGGSGIPTLYRSGALVTDTPEPAVAASHHGQYADFIRGTSSEKPVANWEYAGPMTEAVLLGTVALRVPGVTLKWDSAALKFTNSELANAMVEEPYRKGHEVSGF